MEIYAAMVNCLDDNIGRLLDYLRQSRQYENTFMFFMSDNGPDGLSAERTPLLSRSASFFANRLVPTGGDRWRLEFPNARSDCAVGAGHCKCAHPDGRPGWLSIVVGDGRSDFCIARRADLVLAKSKLIEECQNSGMPHFAFRSFDEATEHLKGWPRVSSNTGHGVACLPLEA